MKLHTYYVYIVTNSSKSVLYIGVTKNLSRRIIQHYECRGNSASFCGRYSCYWLLYFEEYQNIHRAIEREKQLKRWTRKRKEELIIRENPNMDFLNYQYCENWGPPLFK